MNRRAIGIFDSGVGGLTVLHAVRDLLPNEDIVYLGDTARLPYGTKSPESVQRYARHAAGWLFKCDIKLLVIACNTATAFALDHLRAMLAPLPVIGVIAPGAAAAVAASRSQRHLVLATEATTAQRAYTKAIQALVPTADVREQSCSLFVALAEEGWVNGDIVGKVAHEYLDCFRELPEDQRPDMAILGCTHFPLLSEAIAAALGSGIKIIDSATTTANAVRVELESRDLLSENRDQGNLRLVATDGAERFARIGSAFLGAEFSADDIEITDIHPADFGVHVSSSDSGTG
jgi:glutamate racemase